MPRKQIPDNAKSLLKELKQLKTEVVNILRTSYKIKHLEVVKPGAKMKDSWHSEVQAFIDWFMELEPPAESFYMEPHIHIMDPEKFFASLRREIAAGPASPRGRNGAPLSFPLHAFNP